MFQSLGVDSPDRNRFFRGLATVLAVGLFVGFLTVPFSFALGVLDSPDVAAGAELVVPTSVTEEVQP